MANAPVEASDARTPRDGSGEMFDAIAGYVNPTGRLHRT